jgi:hypothetical protein
MWKNIFAITFLALVAFIPAQASSAPANPGAPVWSPPAPTFSGETFSFDTKGSEDAKAAAALRAEAESKRVGKLAALSNRLQSLHFKNVPKLAWLILACSTVLLIASLIMKARPRRPWDVDVVFRR